MRKLAVMLCLLLSFGVTIHSFAEAEHTPLGEGATIIIDGEVAEFEDQLYRENGRIFAPVRALVDYYNSEISWDGELKQVLLVTPLGDELLFTIGEAEMYFNQVPYVMDVAPFIISGRTYIPLRHAVEFLHAEVEWYAEHEIATIATLPLYEVEEEDDWQLVSERFGTTVELLRERNEIDDDMSLVAGATLKVVIPMIMAEPIIPPEPEEEEEVEVEVEPHPELELMAKIIMVEAGWEPYEGQLAVGSVIMNRIDSDRFDANTVYDVVYAPNQFPPAHNGLLDNAVPNESSWKAAEAVLAGENNTDGALYFNNAANIKPGSFWDRLTFVKQIGNQRFYK